MSKAYLGEVFDIHGGGIDLVFPHHENEIAQSRCAHGTDLMARVWMHNGFLQVEGRKMSKSEGNFVVIRQQLQRLAGSVLRLTMLKTHYREPLNWTELSVEESRRELHDWAAIASTMSRQDSMNGEIDDEFMGHLANDLNSPDAITRLRALFRKAQKDPKKNLGQFVASVKFLGFDDILKVGHFRSGIAYWVPKDREDAAHRANLLAIFARATVANNLPEAKEMLRKIEEIGAKYQFTEDGDIDISFTDKPLEEIVAGKIKSRNAARKSKDFKEADRIRDELAAMGVQLKDAKDPETGELVTTWEVAR